MDKNPDCKACRKGIKRYSNIHVTIRYGRIYEYGGWTGETEVDGFNVCCDHCSRVIDTYDLDEACGLIARNFRDEE